jgi:hypothetical protein
MKRDWSLTAESLERFLSWLASDREEAGTRYLELKKKLIRFFIQGGGRIPEELFDRTVDIVSKKILAGEVDPAIDRYAYCHGVARLVLKEDRRKLKDDPLEVDPPAPPTPTGIDERGLKCLDICLGQLGEKERDLATRYHTYERGKKIPMRRKMADEIGGQNKLRIRICRITNRLRECVEACLAQSAGEFTQ